jgi:hypothetical protein
VLECQPARLDFSQGLQARRKRWPVDSLRQATLSQRLNPPCDPPDQEVPVGGPRRLAEDLLVLLAQLADRHLLQRGEFFANVQRHASSP